jgi:hypothetical protein
MRISNMAVELPLDTVIGPTYDGLDLITSAGEFKANEMAFDLWCLLLNHGYRVAGTASSDACFDRPGGATPGAARTYTYLEEEFSLPAVARATAKGRTFVSTGPLLVVSADGRPPGSVLPANGRSTALRIDAWASGADSGGLTRWDVLRDGKLLQSTTLSPPVATLATNFTIPPESAWYCVRVFGSDPQRQRAISGAFFVDAIEHQPPPPAPARVKVRAHDVVSGAPISGALTEITYLGVIPREGKRHELNDGSGAFVVPATVRLRLDAQGYQPVEKSIFLDNAAMVELITGLQAEDLLQWTTFERVRELLGEVSLEFSMKKQN